MAEPVNQNPEQIARDLTNAQLAGIGAHQLSASFIDALARRAMAEQAAQLAAEREEEEAIMLLLAA